MKKLLLLVLPILLGLIIFVIFITVVNGSGSGKGALQVTSIPASNVYMDGKFIGKTPLCKCEGKDMFATGEHTIRLLPLQGTSDQLPFQQKITINKSVLTVVDRTFGNVATSHGSIVSLSPLTDKNKAALSLFSFPQKVAVSLDNTLVGKTPLLLTTTESDHMLTLSKEGYKTKTLPVHAVKGYALTATIFLGIDEAYISSQASAVTPSATPASVLVSQVTILNTPTGFLRVREDASVDSSEIARVNPGETFTLVSEQEGWFQIKLTNGKNGWISSSYAQKK